MLRCPLIRDPSGKTKQLSAVGSKSTEVRPIREPAKRGRWHLMCHASCLTSYLYLIHHAKYTYYSMCCLACIECHTSKPKVRDRICRVACNICRGQYIPCHHSVSPVSAHKQICRERGSSKKQDSDYQLRWWWQLCLPDWRGRPRHPGSAGTVAARAARGLGAADSSARAAWRSFGARIFIFVCAVFAEFCGECNFPPVKGPTSIAETCGVHQRSTKVPLRRSALSACPCCDPCGTPLPLDINYSWSPAKPPKGTNTKVTSAYLEKRRDVTT